MVKQDISSQYDDDLTLGTEYDDSYYTDADDLFDFSTNDESPISRLKSLVLSIDWEITDEVLLQFNEELIDLKGIWAGNSINLVYLQALEKISKYIYQNKANSHPTAIKLLLTLYYNLEKIVSSDELTEAQKKEILLEDVKKFEALKRQISPNSKPAQSRPTAPSQAPGVNKAPGVKKEAAPEDKLLNLKAVVLGIDWEITDQDLSNLRREVIRLEGEFADSRPKLILLQGIGALGAYIENKKSNSHADAFRVLHLFFESLEKIVKTPMSLQEEKAILFPAVEKFNDFKKMLGPTISPEAIGRKADEDEEEDDDFEESGSGVITPALADAADEEMGFQAEEEARSLGIDTSEGVVSHIDSFFGQPVSPATGGDTDATADAGGLPAGEESAAGFDEAAVMTSAGNDVALQGVDVGPDDEEEDAEEYEPAVAALADVDEDAVSEWSEISGDADDAVAATDEKSAVSGFSEEDIANATDSLFEDEEFSASGNASGIDREIALQGVDVETEADEDSDEISLPMEGEEVAPALTSSEEESLFSVGTLETKTASGDLSEEIAGTLDDLFLEDRVPAFAAPETGASEDLPNEADLEGTLEEAEVESLQVEEPAMEATLGEIEGEPSAVEIDLQSEFTEGVAASEDEAHAAVHEEEDLGLFFEGGELEQNVEETAAVDSLFESMEPALILEEEGVPSEREEPLPALDEKAAEEDVLSLEDEVSFMEEISPVDASSPDEEPFSFVEEESTSDEEEITLVEEDSSLEEDVAPAAEMSQETFSAAMDGTPEEAPPAGSEFEATLSPAEEAAFIAATSPADQDLFEGEEVVFELADEPAGKADSVAAAPAQAEPEPAFADEIAEDTAPAFLDEKVHDEVVLPFAAAEFGKLRHISSDPLAGLGVCIESLGIELNDRIISGLFQEINVLRQKWADRPLEKTFLQLMSTITQHIDCYRFEASAESPNLLLSVYNALSARREDDMQHNQELLLKETLKVLEWQQGMFARQAMRMAAQLPSVAPVGMDAETVESVADARDDFDQLLQQYEETEDTGFAGRLAEDAGQQRTAGRESFGDELKQEIASLRLTLQKEIAQLRNELKGK